MQGMSFVNGIEGLGRLRRENADSMSLSRQVISICPNKTEAELVATSVNQLEPCDTDRD